jgi:hypothetical protein
MKNPGSTFIVLPLNGMKESGVTAVPKVVSLPTPVADAEPIFSWNRNDGGRSLALS